MSNKESPGFSSKVVAALPYLCTILVFVAVCLGLNRTRRADTNFCHVTSFCDGRVYIRAIQDYRAGSDPYAPEAHGLNFVYPPNFLRVGVMLSKLLPGAAGWRLYLALLCIGMCSIPWSLTAFLRSAWMSAMGIGVLFIFEPKLYAEDALLMGNIATICYAAILAAAIPGIRRNRWTLFYLAILVSASMKPPFLTLLLLPWLGGTRQLWRSAATGCAVVAVYLVQSIADRQLFIGFLNSVHNQVLDTSDVGIGFLAIFYKVHSMQSQTAMLGSAALIVGMLLSLVWLSKFRSLPGAQKVWMPTLLVAAILANPRMLYYDAYIAVVPAIFLFVEWALSLPATKPRSVWIIVPAAIFILVFSIGPATGIFFLLFGSVALTILRMAAESLASVKRAPFYGVPSGVQDAA